MTDVVTKSWKTPQGLIAHQIVDEEGVGKPVQTYTKIFGGLSWPSADSPAYHCMLGEEFAGVKDGKVIRGKVRLLAESESDGLSLDGFFGKVTDDAVTLYCDTVFAAMDELKYSDFCNSYQDFLYDHDVHFGRIDQAPFEKEFVVGLAYIQDWHKRGRLEIPANSIIYNQLKSCARHNLGERPEVRFYAINAFRFVVAGFHKYKPSIGRRRRRRRNAMAL